MRRNSARRNNAWKKEQEPWITSPHESPQEEEKVGECKPCKSLLPAAASPPSNKHGREPAPSPPLLRGQLLQQPDSPGGTVALRAPCPQGHHGTASPGTLAAGGAPRDARRKDAVASAVPTLPLGTESHRLPGLPAGDACQGWIFCSSPFHVNYQRAANVSSLLPALSARRLLLAGLPCKKRAPQPWGGVGARDPSRCCLALQARCVLLSWDGQENRHIC